MRGDSSSIPAKVKTFVFITIQIFNSNSIKFELKMTLLPILIFFDNNFIMILVDLSPSCLWWFCWRRPWRGSLPSPGWLCWGRSGGRIPASATAGRRSEPADWRPERLHRWRRWRCQRPADPTSPVHPAAPVSNQLFNKQMSNWLITEWSNQRSNSLRVFFSFLG